MGRSRLGWALNAIAPWCLALCFVVSITAEAGQDPAHGAGVAEAAPDSTIRQAVLSSAFQFGGHIFGASGASFLDASLTLGEADELAAVDDEVDPRADLKAPGAIFPSVDRTLKGDALLLLRPGFNSRLTRRLLAAKEMANPERQDTVSFDDPFGSSAAALGYGEDGLWDDAPPWTSSAEKSLSFDDGATPSVPLEVALNSSTPTPSDDKPIAIVAKPEASGANSSQVALTSPGGAPSYASLIDPKDSARQQRCLAEAIYFEARSEPEEGQAAVAQVVLNRVRSGLYPANVCSVVYQDRNRPFACQFSFACEGRSLRITEPGPWAVATRIAQAVVEGKVYNAKVGSALNYHANYVMPYWAGALRRVDRIGHHIFYDLRISQN